MYPSFDEHFDRFVRPRNIARNDFALGQPPRPEYRSCEPYMQTYTALVRAAQEAAAVPVETEKKMVSEGRQ